MTAQNSKTERRDILIAFRVAPSERKALDDLARREGTALSSLIRAALAERAIAAKRP